MPTVVVEALGAASSSDAVLVEVAASAPKAKAAPRNAAPPKANQVIIAGRMFTRLKRGGLSCSAVATLGKTARKTLVTRSTLTRQKLSTDCWRGRSVVTRDEHVDRGGNRFGKSLWKLA